MRKGCAGKKVCDKVLLLQKQGRIKGNGQKRITLET